MGGLEWINGQKHKLINKQRDKNYGKKIKKLREMNNIETCQQTALLMEFRTANQTRKLHFYFKSNVKRPLCQQDVRGNGGTEDYHIPERALLH
jgi:hypothetical protein